MGLSYLINSAYNVAKDVVTHPKEALGVLVIGGALTLGACRGEATPTIIPESPTQTHVPESPTQTSVPKVLNIKIDNDFEESYKRNIEETLVELTRRLYKPTSNELIEVIPLEENPWKKAGLEGPQSSFVDNGFNKEPFHYIIYSDAKNGSLEHEAIHVIYFLIKDKHGIPRVANANNTIGYPRSLEVFLEEGTAELYSFWDGSEAKIVDGNYILNFGLTEDEKNYLNGLRSHLAAHDLPFTFFLAPKGGAIRHPEGLLLASEAIPAMQRIASSSPEVDLEYVRDRIAEYLMLIDPWKSPQYTGGGRLTNKLTSLGCENVCLRFVNAGITLNGDTSLSVEEVLRVYSTNISQLPSNLPEKATLKLLLDDITRIYEQNKHLDTGDRRELIEMIKPKYSELDSLADRLAYGRITEEAERKPSLIGEILNDLSEVNTLADLENLFNKWYVINGHEKDGAEMSQ